MTVNKLIDEIAMGVLGYPSENFCLGEIKYEKILEDVKQLAGVTSTFANIIDSVFNHSPPKGKNVGVVIDSPQGKCVVMKEEDFKIMYENNKKTEELKEQYNVVVGTSNKYADEVEELKEKLIEKSTSYLTKCEIDLLKTKKVYALEEENKKLKETIQHCEGVMESDEDLEERLKAQHADLAEENEEYELIIGGLGTMIENIDQNACDVFNKLTQEYRNQFDEVHHK